MNNKEAIKYLIPPVATSTIPGEEYLKQKEAFDLAIRALEERPQCNQIAWEQGYDVGLAQGKQNRPQGEWISVKERLPDKHGFYLVTLHIEDAHFVDITLFYPDKPEEEQWDLNFVIAWQSLPEPYMKGGAE